ncbi:MAG: hypothetical protein ACXABY_00795 [Candidatus Thorarchaeota archaeon]|jgi:hypothetical protein
MKNRRWPGAILIGTAWIATLSAMLALVLLVLASPGVFDRCMQ